MEVKAQVKNLRVSPRKARLVVDLVRGMTVEDALAQYRATAKTMGAQEILDTANSEIGQTSEQTY